MGIDDRYKVIGKAAEDYVAIRKELAALMHKAQELGTNLRGVADYLCSLNKQPTEMQSGSEYLGMTSFEEIQALLRDLENRPPKTSRTATDTHGYRTRAEGLRVWPRPWPTFHLD